MTRMNIFKKRIRKKYQNQSVCYNYVFNMFIFKNIPDQNSCNLMIKRGTNVANMKYEFC